jgi:hypothetical protein
MGRLIIHSSALSPEKIQEERALRFLNLPPQEKLFELLALIHLSIAMNGGQPIKKPQGKGIIIQRPR